MFKNYLESDFGCVWWTRVDSYGNAARSGMYYAGTLRDSRKLCSASQYVVLVILTQSRPVKSLIYYKLFILCIDKYSYFHCVIAPKPAEHAQYIAERFVPIHRFRVPSDASTVFVSHFSLASD